MAWKQAYQPKIDTKARRGWCLKYVDDAGNAPKRTANAYIAYSNEKKASRINRTTPPKNVWVVGFLDIKSGDNKNLDHVFFMKYLGNGKYDIRDSETNSGARRPYGSINELLAWFAAKKPTYSGWSSHCDGREYAEYVKPKPTKPKPAKKLINKKTPRGQYDVLRDLPGYLTAADAIKGKRRKTTVKKGRYYIFNRTIRARNVTKKKGVPGSWIKHSSNKK